MWIQFKKLYNIYKVGKFNLMAERVGFEPTVRLHVRWFSRPVLSTTQPSLQYFYMSKLNLRL